MPSVWLDPRWMPSVTVLADSEYREALHLSEDLAVVSMLLHADCFLWEMLPGCYKAGPGFSLVTLMNAVYLLLHVCAHGGRGNRIRIHDGWGWKEWCRMC